MDARDRVGPQVQAAERLPENRLDASDRLGLDRIGEQPDPVPVELGEVAAEPEIAEASTGQLEQLIPRLSSGDAAAQLRKRAQRTPRRIAMKLLGLHSVAGSDAPAAVPM